MAGADRLPEEIAMEVFHRLTLLDDMAVFGAVCKSWRSVAVAALPRKIRTPFLIMLAREEDTGGDGVLRFHSLADDRIYGMRVPPQTMVAKKCFGIGFGWILTVGSGQIDMVHLLQRRQISLPPQPSLPKRFGVSRFGIKRCAIRKAVASSDPSSSSSSCIIMVIWEESGLLAFTRPGYKAWVDVFTLFADFVDVISYQGKFYAITQKGLIVTCSIDDEGNQTITKLGTHWVSCSHKYLVESCGELLVVFRVYDRKETRLRGDYVTDSFEVLRMEEEEDEVAGAPKYNDNVQGKFKFARVKDLGDKALFVGDNASFSITASTANGCRSNCIYFTQDSPESSDIGIYNMGDRDIEEEIGSLHSPSYYHPPHSLWYI